MKRLTVKLVAASRAVVGSADRVTRMMRPGWIKTEMDQLEREAKLLRIAIARYPHKRDCYINEGHGFEVCSCGAEEKRSQFLKRIGSWK